MPAVSSATVASLRASFSASALARMDANQLGERLAELQLANSRNAAQNPESSKFRESIKKVNAMIARKLASGAPLTIEDLDEYNFLANGGLNIAGSGEQAPMAGVLRGTNDRVVDVDGKPVLVDLSYVQSGQGARGIQINSFAPDNMVLPAMKNLVEKINRLGSTSDPREAFALYQELIRIHGYVDGNGRTGRVLLNYMLLKLKLPPMPSASESLYYSADELLARYVQLEAVSANAR